MPINYDVFDKAVIRALDSDVEIVLPQCLKALKLLLGNSGEDWSIDRAYNELFYLNLYTYCLAIDKRFKGYGGELTNRLNNLVESFLKKRLSEELVIVTMAKLNLRFLEYSKRVNEFVQNGIDQK
ncbi:hypothetical protein IMZ48_48935, partial [Candidatus Bathyarchaeota archaeon]|nr:hypothetical protein [Candidatus Bathyarchaeota archaeon]